MNKILFQILFALCIVYGLEAQQQITEGTLTYVIQVDKENTKTSLGDMLDGAKNVVYLKGNNSRLEFISTLGVQTTIIDGKSKNVTVLKEFGKVKYLIKMTSDEWKIANKKHENIQFEFVDETKTIAGYLCHKAIGRLKDGSKFTVYYTKELAPTNYEFLYLNKGLPGLAMEYESSMVTTKVVITISSINFDPIPYSKFQIPTSGYRVLSFEESMNLSK